MLSSALFCLAINIYHEAREEEEIAQHAVAQVTLNRADWDRKNICPVVLERKQFSWTTNLVKRGKVNVLHEREFPKDEKAWATALKVARENLNGRAKVVVGNSRFYHAHHVRPAWAKSMSVHSRIGSHIFLFGQQGRTNIRREEKEKNA